MLDTTTPPAAGQPETPTPTISAARDAANKNDFSAFDKADRAQRIGKPLAEVVPKVDAKVVTPPVAGPADGTPPAAGSGQPPAPKTTEKDRLADERLRARVAEAVAERDTKIADLERRLSDATTGRREPEQTATPPAPVPEKFPTLAEYGATHENASLEDWLEARDEWRDQRRELATRERTESEQRGRTVQERTGRFTAALETAKAADPDVLTKLPPEILTATGFTATPLSGCQMDRAGTLIDPQTGQPATFRSVVAEVALRSENGVALLTYLHAHRDEVTRITSLPVPDWFEALTRLDGRVAAAGPPTTPPATEATTPPVAVPSTITAAPPPVPTLSRPGSTLDPKKAALARNDFAEFDRIEMAEKRAQRATA